MQKSRIGLYSAELQLGVAGDDACENTGQAPAFAPVKAGVLDGKRTTCYPSFESRFGPSTTAVEDRVVVDGTVTTSRGPGTALVVALELAGQLSGPAKADELL